MAEDIQIERDLIRDLLTRLKDPNGHVREAAAEALAMNTEDEDWRPEELIRQGGIDTLKDLLMDKNLHIVSSVLDIIIATAANGGEEELISAGIIAMIDSLQDHRDPEIRKRVREALWLLQPEVEDVVTSKPQDEY
jgi:HEAT repeat protein